MQKRPTASYRFDNGASFFDTSSDGTGTLQSFQFRIGGRYFPPSPVQTSAVGGTQSNGAVEAYVELAKALNVVGDNRLSTNVSAKSWGRSGMTVNGVTGFLQEYDYSTSFAGGYFANEDNGFQIERQGAAATFNSFCGTAPSQNFCMATNLETSNGNEIAGLNAEEQSDITLQIYWKSPQVLGSQSSGPSNIETFTYYDAMLVLRENNVIELIQ